MHKRNLEDDIESETSGHLKRILVSMVQANRLDTPNPPPPKKKKTHKKMTNLKYFQCTNVNLEDDIESETSGHLRRILVSMVQANPPPPKKNLKKKDKTNLFSVHKRHLEDDIESETSGHLKRILVSMVQANRPDTPNSPPPKKNEKKIKIKWMKTNIFCSAQA